jgi:hypothetical protein
MAPISGAHLLVTIAFSQFFSMPGAMQATIVFLYSSWPASGA